MREAYRTRKVEGEKKKPFSELNMVPYLDVMLVLLVIFMIAVPQYPWGMKVDLPKVAKSEQKGLGKVSAQKALLTLKVDGKRWLMKNGGQEVIIDDAIPLTETLKAQEISKDHTVYIKAEGDVKWEFMLSQMVELKALGFEAVTFLIDKAVDDKQKK